MVKPPIPEVKENQWKTIDNINIPAVSCSICDFNKTFILKFGGL